MPHFQTHPKLYMCVCIRAYVNISIYNYIYINMHIMIYNYIYNHIYIYIYLWKSQLLPHFSSHDTLW